MSNPVEARQLGDDEKAVSYHDVHAHSAHAPLLHDSSAQDGFPREANTEVDPNSGSDDEDVRQRQVIPSTKNSLSKFFVPYTDQLTANRLQHSIQLVKECSQPLSRDMNRVSRKPLYPVSNRHIVEIMQEVQKEKFDDNLAAKALLALMGRPYSDEVLLSQIQSNMDAVAAKHQEYITRKRSQTGFSNRYTRTKLNTDHQLFLGKTFECSHPEFLDFIEQQKQSDPEHRMNAYRKVLGHSVIRRTHIGSRKTKKKSAALIAEFAEALCPKTPHLPVIEYVLVHATEIVPQLLQNEHFQRMMKETTTQRRRKKRAHPEKATAIIPMDPSQSRMEKMPKVADSLAGP